MIEETEVKPEAPGTPASSPSESPQATAPALPSEEIARLSDEIVASLKTVYDPEIPVYIY